MADLIENPEAQFSHIAAHMSHILRKQRLWLLNRSDTNSAVQAQEMARGCKF